MMTFAFISGLVGCGNPERDAARQKFKAAVGAVKVRTQGSTYSEFRQAELDLKTAFEVNKRYLEDVSEEFSKLNDVLSAQQYCWDRWDVLLLDPRSDDWTAMKIINPDLVLATAKAKYESQTFDQSRNDPDFSPKVYVRLSLNRINEHCVRWEKLLEKK